VPDRATFKDTPLDIVQRAQFAWSDILRRAQGNVVGAFGFDPREHSYRVLASGPYWRLRDYGGRGSSATPLLLIAAPIKRPYIWDLAPAASAVRYCLRQGLRVNMLEWKPASRLTGNPGLDEYMQAIADSIAKVSKDASNSNPVLAGHSLGGTLAAIYGASAPKSAKGLVLLDAPLCFQPGTSRFRDGLVSLVPPGLSGAGSFPGSLLSYVSALASPHTFVWSRLMDAGLSMSDHRAMEIHGRVERWSLDEVPLPGKLVHQILDWLYREDRLYRGTLKIGGKAIGPGNLSLPTLVVVNSDDDVASPMSIRPFVAAMPRGQVQVIEYPGETGVCLQHLAILVGHEAFRTIWPKIIAWVKARR